MAESSQRNITAFLMGASLLALPCPALAGGAVGDMNYNETTGLIDIPVARVAPAGSIQLSLGFQNAGGKGSPFGIDVDDKFFDNDGTIKAIAGIGHNLEISVMGLHGGVFNRNRYIFGAKWLAVRDAPDHPAFAVGVQSINLGPEPNNPHPASWDKPDFFGVVSHSFPLNDDGMAFDLHAGIGTARLSNGFAGGEFHINSTVSLMGEWDGTIGHAGVRITPSSRFEIMPNIQFQKRTGPAFAQGPIRYGLMASYRFGRTEEPDETAEELDKTTVEPQKGQTRVVTPEELKQLEQPPAPAPAPGSTLTPPARATSPTPPAPAPEVKAAPAPPPEVAAAPPQVQVRVWSQEDQTSVPAPASVSEPSPQTATAALIQPAGQPPVRMQPQFEENVQAMSRSGNLITPATRQRGRILPMPVRQGRFMDAPIQPYPPVR